MNKKPLCLLLFFALPLLIFAQQDAENQDPPRAFDNISLGMSYDAVLNALADNTNFIYRGKPDVSMLDPIDRTTIEVRGAGFVYRGFFTFYNDTLYSISIVMNSGRLDYFTLLQQLKSRYGHPTTVNPDQSIWENTSTRLSLEYPATLKYLDLDIFQSLLDRNNTDRSALDRSRQQFLEGL